MTETQHVEQTFVERYGNTPAARIIDHFGSIEAVADIIERDRSVVNRWLLPATSGGTGGDVPGKHQSTLLEASRKQAKKAKRKSLTPGDFFRK